MLCDINLILFAFKCKILQFASHIYTDVCALCIYFTNNFLMHSLDICGVMINEHSCFKLKCNIINLCINSVYISILYRTWEIKGITIFNGSSFNCFSKKSS